MAHSLPSKYQILCNISIRNWVLGTWSNSRWRTCWSVENLIIDPYVLFFGADFPSLWCKNLIDAQIMAQILKIWFVTSLGCWFFIWIQNLVQKCRSTPKLWPKIEIKMAAVRHLGFVKIWLNNNTNTNTTELVWRPLQTKFGQGRLTIKNKNKNCYIDKTL